MLKTVNGVIVFFMELVMIAAFAYYGYQLGGLTIIKYIFALSLPVIALILWAVFAAPKSSRRLHMPALACFRAGMFLAVAFTIFQSGYKTPGIIFAGAAISTQLTSYFVGR